MFREFTGQRTETPLIDFAWIIAASYVLAAVIGILNCAIVGSTLAARPDSEPCVLTADP